MEPSSDTAPRILILEPDQKIRSALLRYAVKGWQGAAVQSMGSSLEEVLGDGERLRSFDVLLADYNIYVIPVVIITVADHATVTLNVRLSPGGH